MPGLDFKSSVERVTAFQAGSIPVPRRHAFHDRRECYVGQRWTGGLEKPIVSVDLQGYMSGSADAAKGGRAAKEVALATRDAELLECFEFVAGLGALGDDLTTELPGDGVKRAQELPTRRVGVDAADQSKVAFDEIRCQFQNGFETAIGYAGVAEGDLEAEILIVISRFSEDRKIVDRFAFRNFENQILGAQSEILKRLTQHLALERWVVNRGR